MARDLPEALGIYVRIGVGKEKQFPFSVFDHTVQRPVFSTALVHSHTEQS